MKNSALIWPASCGHRAFYLHPVMTKAIGKRALLCATALVSVASAGWADEVIDGGAVEIVDGAGTGDNGTKDSPWIITGDLEVGSIGIGELIVRNGGSVSNTNGDIGRREGSDGEVTVTGAGSSWANSRHLFVGYFSTGALTVSDGGSVSNTDGVIGYGGSDGEVTVTGKGSSWVNSGRLLVGYVGTGALTIADGATVTVVDGLNLATESSGAGTLNIGAAAGDNAAAAGTLAAANVGFGAGAGEIVFNHTDTGYAFDPTISGNGTVSVLAGTTVLNGAHSYSGDTEISGGVLIVNGSITADTLVTGSGTLGGSGTVGDVTMSSGATLAPGNSIGTLNTGDTAFAAGSQYAVEVNAAGGSDLLASSGEVVINTGATLDVTSETLGEDGSSYGLATEYTIITATGGVTGTFDTVTDSFAFLDAGVRYATNDVHLQLTRNDIGLADVVQTPNQIATGKGVDSLGAGSALYDVVIVLETADVAAAFDAMSGEANATVKTQMIQNGTLIVDQILNSTRRADDVVPAPAVTRAAYAAPPSRNTWGTLFATRTDRDATTNTAAMEQTIGGALAGVDLLMSPTLQFGVTLGLSGSDYDIADRQSSGTVNTAHLGFYSNGKSGPLNLQFGATYSHHEIESDRVVTRGTDTDELSASYTAQSVALFTEVSRDFARITPFANASYVMLDTDEFSESGGASALTVEASSQEVAFASFGLRADHRFSMGGTDARLTGSAAWLHAAGDLDTGMDAAFDGGASFHIQGAPIAPDAAVITAGVDFDLGRGTSVGFGYAGQLGEDTQSYSLEASLTKSF